MNEAPSPIPPEPVEWACLPVARDLARVGPAVQALIAWLRARGAPADETLDEIGLAVTEALTNAVRHGDQGRPDIPVRLAWRRECDELEIEVSEPGEFHPGPDWDALPDDPLAEGGRGGFLISQLMDSAEHRNAAGRHALVMRRALPRRPLSELAANESALDAMTEHLGNAYETIAALFGLAEDLATAADLRRMAEKSLARLRPLLGADAAWVRLAGADGSLVRLSADGAPTGPDELPADHPGAEADVARSGAERTLPRRAELGDDDPLRAPRGCAFVCPFSFEGRLRGVLAVARETDGEAFFTAGQTGLARTLADFLGIACANSDLLAQRRAREQARRELEIAAQIQRALLPGAIPPHPGWDVAGECAQAAEVGGDFFDVIDRADGARLVVIADVMGKGVPAALMAATLRTALRSLAHHLGGPGELLTRVNHQLCADLGRIDMFITAQIVWLDADGRALRLASAGHCPPLLLAHNGRAAWWDEAGGLPVGVSADETYAEATREPGPGGSVWLMTDGALEHEDASGEQLGEEAFAGMAASCAAPAVLLARLRVRAAGRPPRDDCTLVRFAPSVRLSHA